MLAGTEGQMRHRDRAVQINQSGIPGEGVGGLGLVVIAGLVAFVMPEIRWSIAAGLAGGVIIAVGIVLARRHRTSAGPSGDDPKILFREMPPARGQSRTSQSADRAAGNSPVTRFRDSPIYS